jgi:CheY-like chemotaxis protein
MDKGIPGQIGREVLRILLLEDRDSDAELVERALRKAGFAYMFERARSEGEFLARLDPAPHVIVSDYYVPGCDALHALRLVRARGLDVPFIVDRCRLPADRLPTARHHVLAGLAHQPYLESASTVAELIHSAVTEH